MLLPHWTKPLRHRKTIVTALAIATLASCAQLPMFAAKPSAELHVPSPVWGDQIIYFVMTDRVEDGDPTNNDQGAGEYDPSDHRRYSGGDLKGIEQRLDDIQGMGATAVWLTPPVANQWYDDYVDYGGYHGYWARDFKSVDEHYGTLEDYQSLSKSLHGRGMYLVQDIVLNHTANYSVYEKNKFNVNDVCENFRLNDQTPPS